MKDKKIRLGDVASFINGRAFKPSEWKTSGIPIIRIQNLTDSGKLFNYYQGNYEYKHLVRKGDILISWSASLGVFEWQNSDALLNQHIFKVVFDKEAVNKTYFKYIIEKVLINMLMLVHGSTMKHITKGDFDRIEIPLPPLAHQEKIAAVLDRADGLRRKRKAAIEKLDRLIQSVFLEMFGDPVTNPKGWEYVNIGNIISHIKDGPHISPKYSDSGIPILSTRNVRPGELVMEDVKYVSMNEYRRITKNFKPQKGDVLLTKGGTTGLAKAVDFDWPFCVWVHIAVLRPKDSINPIYLEAALNSKYCYVQSQKYTHGIANRDLGLKRIVNIELLFPPKFKQDEFASVISAITAQKNKMQASLQKLDENFNSLLQRAFNGELDFNDTAFTAMETDERIHAQ